MPEKVKFSFSVETYETIANLQGVWETQANILLLASNILEGTYKDVVRAFASPLASDTAPDELWLRGPILMLKGLAVECLLKAIRLRQGKLIVRDGRVITKTHDLVRLATEVGLKLEPPQKYMLKYLTRVVVWAGRYPVAKSRDDQLDLYNLFAETIESGDPYAGQAPERVFESILAAIADKGARPR